MLRFHFSIERWKFNKEYSIYVSTWGNIKDGKKKDKNIYANHGYLFVEVNKKLIPVHRLVMETFKPQKLNLTVDHIDHNTRNNHISNLRWLSKEENENDNNREKVFKEVKKQEEKTFTDWRKKIKKCAQKHTENYQGGGFSQFKKMVIIKFITLIEKVDESSQDSSMKMEKKLMKLWERLKEIIVIHAHTMVLFILGIPVMQII